MFGKKKSPHADALIEAARAEFAAKRKMRETRFADTVLGWESEEEAAAEDPFPQTVVGWDHAEAHDKPADARLNVLFAMERSAAGSDHARAKRFVYVVSAVLMLLLVVFLALAFI
jgi:hypothetical protein